MAKNLSHHLHLSVNVISGANPDKRKTDTPLTAQRWSFIANRTEVEVQTIQGTVNESGCNNTVTKILLFNLQAIRALQRVPSVTHKFMMNISNARERETVPAVKQGDLNNGAVNNWQ